MQTFKQYHIEEGKIGKALAMGALATSSLFGNFVQDWSSYYQTSDDPQKEARATAVLQSDITAPADAKMAIRIAARIFAGDEGHSEREFIDVLEKTGAVESGYRTKVQDGGGPARSYWQVEPKTAMSLVKNSHQYFGSKFHKAFGKDALKILQSYDEKAWSNILEKNDALGATIAAAKWLSTPW
tara:strand:- start:26 stop:577 length:552 start_codon:yes stop_codon:yes gene_type:complete